MADNEVSFILKLRDYITSPLQKATGAATNLGNSFEKTQSKISSTLSSVGNKATVATSKMKTGFSGAYENAQFLNHSIDELKEKLNSVNAVRFGTVLKSEFKQATREANRLQRQIHRLERGGGSRLKTWISDAFNQVPFANLLKNPVAIAGAGIGAAIKLGMEQQKNRINFETLTGNKSTGDKLFGNLQNLSVKTPYSQKTILGESQALLAYGVSVKNILPNIKMMGDIAMGNNDHFKRLALAFGEVKEQGYLTGRQLRQFAALGLNPLIELQKMTGLSSETLRKKMAKGAITFDMVRKAMQHATGPGGRFNNMMKNVMEKSFSGQLNATINSISLMMAKLGELILPILTKALGLANKAFGWIVDHKGLVLGALVAIGGGLLIANIQAIGAGIAFGVMNSLIAMGTGLMKLFNLVIKDNPLGFMVGIVIAAVLWFTHLWKTSEKFRMVIMGVWGVLKGFAGMLKDIIIGRIKELLSGIGKVGQAIALLFNGHFGAAWSTAKDAAKDFAGAGTAKRIAEDVSKIRGGYITKAYKAGAEEGKKSFEASMAAHKKANNNTPSGQLAMSGGKTDTSLANSIMSGGSGGKAGSDSISGKGPRNVTINLKSLVEKLEIRAVTTQQGIREMEDNVKEALLRILNSANAVLSP